MFLQSHTVSIEASWSVLVSWAAVGISIYNTWLRRETRTKKEIEEETRRNERIEILWSVMFPSGISKALRAGILEKNSPLRWSLEALQRHHPLVERIKEFYSQKCRSVDDLKLLLNLSQEFEKDFTQLVKENPIYTYEAVLLSAFYLVRADSELFRKYKFATEEDAADG